MGTYRDIKKVLTEAGIEQGEATAIAMMLMDEIGGLSKTDVLMGLEPNDTERVTNAARRVAKGEPVQYVIGKTQFCGIDICVNPNVLIPRPETEELVRWVAQSEPKHVLDIGTGSGCIAVALAKMLRGAEVTAVDVSAEALAVAKENARRAEVNVRFIEQDILKEDIKGEEGEYDMIVSNPPYICHSEAADMNRNVLEHEPHLSLFVTDDDPLLFYRRIALIATKALSSGGRLAYEINRRFGTEVVAMLEGMGYVDVTLKQDQFGNNRMIMAIKQ